MHLSPQSPLRELAIHLPGATRVFDARHFDYCCQGARSLEAACVDAGIPISDVLSELERESRRSQEQESASPLSSLSLESLISHILDRHHVFEREEMERISAMMAKVLDRHGSTHPRIRLLSRVVTELFHELRPHFFREEAILFPHIIAMEQARRAGRPCPPVPFGTVHNPIRVMSGEHEAAGEHLARIRSLTDEFTPPEDACTTFRALYQALQEFQTDLIRHVHLENNLLFPKALDLEDSFALQDARPSQP